MAEKTPSTSGRDRVLGDIKVRFYTFTDIDNGDTFVLPTGTAIIGAFPVRSSTTAVVAVSVSTNTITFNTSGDNNAVTLCVVFGA